MLYFFNKYKNIFYILLLYIFIPNFIFDFYVLWAGLSRPLINFDYFLIYFLIYFSTNRFLSILGYLLFFTLFLCDVFFIIYQYFPFIKLNDLLYLSSFILNGPKIYLYAMWGAILISLLIYSFIYKVYFKVNVKQYILTTLSITCLCLVLNNFFTEQKWSVWGKVEFKFGASQIVNFFNNFDSNYNQISNNKELLEVASYKGATDKWFNHDYMYKNKTLLVVNESWGYPRENIRNEVLKNIKAISAENYEEGKLSFVGATVAGELRELCRLNTRSFSLRLAENGFEHCLPHKLIDKGYQTYALHGAMGILYDRVYWYPRAGFKNILTFEELTKFNLKKCKAFSGICDDELFGLVQDTLINEEKVFFYWLTLKTHVPYEDATSSRFDCKKLNVEEDTETCRWAKLQTDFFDKLALMLEQPKMKGVEVIVVGDHPTPIFNLAESIKYFKSNQEISYLHIKN